MEKYTNIYMYKNNGENGSIKCNNHILTSQPYILIPKISTSRKFGNEWAFDTNIKFKLTSNQDIPTETRRYHFTVKLEENCLSGTLFIPLWQKYNFLPSHFSFFENFLHSTGKGCSMIQKRIVLLWFLNFQFLVQS